MEGVHPVHENTCRDSVQTQTLEGKFQLKFHSFQLKALLFEVNKLVEKKKEKQNKMEVKLKQFPCPYQLLIPNCTKFSCSYPSNNRTMGWNVPEYRLCLPPR